MINVVVEGESDREVAKTVVVHAGHRVHLVRIAGGKTRLDPLITKYNIASAQYPWVVFRDSDSECPVTLRARVTAGISSWHPQFCLRIAHSMSEAWLLADRDGSPNTSGCRLPGSRVTRSRSRTPNRRCWASAVAHDPR